MQQVALVAFWLAMALYAGATVLYAYYFVTKRTALSWYATFLTGAGFLMHTASIGLRSSATDGTELTGANVLVLMAWALVLVYFIFEHLIKIKVYGTVLVPLALLLMLIASLLGVTSGVVAELPADQAMLLDSWRVGIHVALIVFANAGFIISAAASVTYLVLERQLKEHKTTKLFKRLPSLSQTDLFARRAVLWAFPAYTAGMLLGALRAIETDVQLWWADPRVILSGIVWLIFGTYLFVRWVRGWGGHAAAYLSIAGTVFVIILSIVARTVPAGFHIFGL